MHFNPILCLFTYFIIYEQYIYLNNIHLGGGRPSFARMDSVGGGSSRNFPGSIFSGGGGSSRNFPGSIFCGVAEFFPLSPGTDPKFVFFSR